MSRNRKYIEQFDRNAGNPSDFDSLFEFEKNKLAAKRRIRMKSSRSRTAAMCTAAAVIAVAAFAALSLINEKGIASDTILSKSEGLTPSTEFTEYLENETALTLSSIIGHFDHNASGLLSEGLIWSEDNMLDRENVSDDFRGVVRFSVASKCYNTSLGIIEYSIRPLEFYAEEYLYEYLLNDPHRFNSFIMPINIDHEELQVGCEYIMPFGKTDEAFEEKEDGGYSIDPSSEDFARKSEKGWLIFNSEHSGMSLFDALSADTERVFDDVRGTEGCCLEPSDEKMTEKLTAYLDGIKDVTFYHGVTDVSEGVSRGGYYNLNSILPKSHLEKVSYSIDPEGNTDRTLLVLDNEKYYYLMPYLSGKVTFAGVTERGELCAAIEISYYGEPEAESYAKTVLISGFETLSVKVGDIIDEDSVIGECSDSPIFMQFIDNNGLPMEIELDDNADETAVSLLIE